MGQWVSWEVMGPLEYADLGPMKLDWWRGVPKLHCLSGQVTLGALVLFPVDLWRPAERQGRLYT